VNIFLTEKMTSPPVRASGVGDTITTGSTHKLAVMTPSYRPLKSNTHQNQP
jgi:hypothetical protein